MNYFRIYSAKIISNLKKKKKEMEEYIIIIIIAIYMHFNS